MNNESLISKHKNFRYNFEDNFLYEVNKTIMTRIQVLQDRGRNNS
jgi:hypothetical protein